MTYWNSNTLSPYYSKSHYRKKHVWWVARSEWHLIPKPHLSFSCYCLISQWGMFVIARRYLNPVPRNWELSYWCYCNLWLSQMLGTKKVASYASWHLLFWRDKYVISAKLKNKPKQNIFFPMDKSSSWKEKVQIEKCLLIFVSVTTFHKSYQNSIAETWRVHLACEYFLPAWSSMMLSRM